jgi:hypothetical protein
MKFSNTVAALATAGLATAHGHGHAHHHKRATETETVNTGPVEYSFVVLDPSKSGAPEAISINEACQGLADHKFEWLDTAVAAACSSSSTATPTSTSTPAPTSTIAPAILQETLAAITPSSSSSTVEPTSSTSSATAAATSSSSSSSSSGATGLTAEFPDGEIDCGSFPSEYGAVALDYLGLGGYSGIQYVTLVDDLVSDIVTAVTGDECHSGAMCSYACPPGYQKSQWPDTQGATGQSVGGLECKGGKLYLTNPGHKQLCIEGVGGVHVKNQMSSDVAVCRTDYPGTESETVPLSAVSGATHPLTCPDGDTYYNWKGKSTSAQYYVNPKGVSAEKGCQWGDGSEPIGNWAPLNLGVGYTKYGKFLSIFPNTPTTTKKLDFNVKLVGDNLSDECRYEGGTFYDSKGAISGNSGCTVSFLLNVLDFIPTNQSFLGRCYLRRRLLRLLRVNVSMT